MAKATKTKSATSTALRKKRARKNVVKGIAHIHSTFNNTIVTITDEAGAVLTWSSAGATFKGSKKSTPYAASIASEAAAASATEYGVKVVDVYVNGTGSGREAAIRALTTKGLEIQSIVDVTPVPHNGCRPPKRPRG